MSILFTEKEFNHIESALADTLCEDDWETIAEELDIDEVHQSFLSEAIHNENGSVEVPDTDMPLLAEMLLTLHHKYADKVLYAGMECEHDDIIMEDFMQSFDLICQVTSMLMSHPGYIRLMKRYRKKPKQEIEAA